MFERYNTTNIKRAIGNPALIIDELKRLGFHIYKTPNKIKFRREYGPGVDIMRRDWDNLIILDACRYDVFEEISWLDGELEAVISRGSHSREFCEKNFAGRTFYDTVYVTANGYGARIGQGVFHDLIFTDDDSSIANVDVLHSTTRGMAPESVYNAAVDAIRTFPNKRKIIHFMQPHAPYLGEEATEVRRRVEDEGLVVRSRRPDKIEQYSSKEENVVNTLSGAAQMGYVSESELRKIYIENLKIVLGYVEQLLGKLEGKTVITADHGEYIRSNEKTGHPMFEYSQELRKVPWLVIDAESRPEVTNDKPTDATAISNESIEKRLEHLGYKN